MSNEEKKNISECLLRSYVFALQQEEKRPATIEKYLRDVRAFSQFLSGRPVTKEQAIAYKEYLVSQYAVRSTNSMLASLNSFLRFAGWSDCAVRQLRTQRRMFCQEAEALTKEEYRNLLRIAKSRDEKLYLILLTLGSTGIRIGELKAVTAEAVQSGKALVFCKSKIRTIFLPERLQERLETFVLQWEIWEGPIFRTRTGKPLDRSNMWKKLKSLCREADVPPEKVFPHNFCHLFARTFYEAEKDLAKLADVLGHSSMDTTRIYILSDGAEHRKQLNQLDLV